MKKRIVYVACTLSVAVMAETATYIGASNTEMESASNWQDGYMPQVGDDVVLPDFGEKSVHQFGLNINFNLNKLTGSRKYSMASSRSDVNITVANPNDYYGIWRTYYGTWSGTQFAADKYGYPKLTLAAVDGFVPVVHRLDMKDGYQVEVPTAGTQATIEHAWGAGVLRKSGAGELKLGGVQGSDTRLMVEDGSITLPSAKQTEKLLADAWFHLDAGVESSLVKSGNEVTQWNDCRNNGLYASKHSGAAAPTYWANELNGKPVVNFGALGGANNTIDEASRTLDGEPAALVFNEPTAKAREVFVVTRYNPNAKGVYFLLGDLTAYDFHSGGSGVDNVQLGNYSNGDEDISFGSICVDGTHVDAATYFSMREYRVLSWGIDGTSQLGTLALDRTNGYRIGGMRIAEVLVYTNKLTAAERTRINNYLGKKYFNKKSNDVGSITCANGTAFNVEAGKIAYVDSITVQGTELIKRGEGILNVGQINSSDPLVKPTIRLEGGSVNIEDGEPVQYQPAANAYLHLDATRADTFTKEYDEANQRWNITEWRDPVSGRNATTNSTVYNLPYLVEGLNGMPVVQFGQMANPSVAKQAGSSSLTFAEPASTNCLREAFLVVALNSNTSQEPFPVGSASVYDIHWGGQFLLSTKYSLPVTVNSEWRIDGAAVAPNVSYSRFDYHLISCHLASNIRVDTLCRDRTEREGGARIAEIIIYDRALTPTERRNTQEYLTQKWFNRYSPTSSGVTDLNFTGDANLFTEGENTIGTVNASGVVTKNGAGTAKVNALGSDVEGLVVTEGELQLGAAPAILKEAALHLDASRTDLMELDTTSTPDKTYVTGWGDVRANGIGAAVPSFVPGKPTLDANALNGMSVVTMGNYEAVYTTYYSFSNPHASGMIFTNACANSLAYNNCKTAFVVASDYSQNKQFMFTSLSTYHFHRADTSGNLLNSTYADATLLNGTAWIDGVECAPCETPLGNGFHVVAFRTAGGDTTVSSICIDRTNRAGGLRVAEELLFNRVLSDAEVASVNKYLLNKWFNNVVPTSLNDVTVAAGAKFTAQAPMTLAANASLTVEIDGANSGVLDFQQGVSSTDNTLQITTPDNKRPVYGRYLVVKTSSVADATALKDSLRVAHAFNGTTLSLAVEGNDIYLNVAPSAMMIFIR